MSRDERIAHWTSVLNGFTRHRWFCTTDEVATRVEPGEAPEAVLDARCQKALLLLVKSRLDTDPSVNQQFLPTTDWKILNQLLTAARLKELTHARIIKKGRSSGLSYDVTGLTVTFFGRQVLDALGFSARRHIMNREEFEKVTAEFQKIKLVLPEAIEPTTTERFFAGELGD